MDITFATYFRCEHMHLLCSDNITQNPGFEAFTGVWDKGFEDIDMNEFHQPDTSEDIEEGVGTMEIE